jgi:hypothetical protein
LYWHKGYTVNTSNIEYIYYTRLKDKLPIKSSCEIEMNNNVKVNLSRDKKKEFEDIYLKNYPSNVIEKITILELTLSMLFVNILFKG